MLAIQSLEVEVGCDWSHSMSVALKFCSLPWSVGFIGAKLRRMSLPPRRSIQTDVLRSQTHTSSKIASMYTYWALYISCLWKSLRGVKCFQVLLLVTGFLKKVRSQWQKFRRVCNHVAGFFPKTLWIGLKGHLVPTEWNEWFTFERINGRTILGPPYPTRGWFRVASLLFRVGLLLFFFFFFENPLSCQPP